MEPARSTLGNRYELRALLATGGMGQVWRAHDQLLGRTVAVKVLRSEYTGNEVFLARFRAEAHHAAALGHPNIAAVFDYGEEQTIDGSGEHLAWLVMELVEGEPLSAVLSREGPLPVERVLDVLRQTASALAVAHDAGVVHRDVKPGNVLVRWDGTVKITDFGIAWSAGSVPLTQTGQVVGTASYLSPEQAGGAHATPASDVYALGMVGYELLTGVKAFDGENSVAVALRHLREQPAPLPDSVPPAVRTLIERCLLKNPARRYADGAAFVAAVDEVLAGRSLPPVEHTGPQPAAGTDTNAWWLLPESATVAAPGPTGAPGATGAQPLVRTPAPSGRRRAGRALVPVAALLVGAGLAVGVLQSFAPAGSAPTTAVAEAAEPTSPETPEGIVLESDQYSGRPVAEVDDELTALGLSVQLQPVRTLDVADHAVIDVSPTGRALAAGASVVVRYAVATSSSTRSTEDEVQTPVDTVQSQPTVPAPAPSTPTGTATATPTETSTPTATPTESEQPDPGSTESAAPVDQPGDPTDGGTPSASPTTGAGNSNGNGNGNGNGGAPAPGSPTKGQGGASAKG